MIAATGDPADLVHKLGIHYELVDWVARCIALLGLLAAGLTILFKVGKAAVKAWKSRHGSGDELRRAQRRSIFAAFVEGRIRDLDNKEEWSDHRFTELEAEVETLGGEAESKRRQRLAPRARGLRRERSLSVALRKSHDKLILLKGDPGAGKSVALRHLVRRMSKEAADKPTLDSIIPLYVNLKALQVDDLDELDAARIHDFVLERLQDGADVDVHRFLRQEFSRGKEAGTWLFLFDSFDEIPAILSATEDADPIVAAYSDAIHGFIHGFNRCRGVVASRHFRGPSRQGLPEFRIVALSEKRKRDLIRKADLGPSEVQLLVDLPNASDDVVALSGNPLFLGLLCDYVRDRSDEDDSPGLPSRWHDVFEAYVTNRMATDRERLATLHGIDDTELRLRAEEIAFTMTAEGLGLSPTRSALADAYATAGFDAAERLPMAMDALEWIKLARSETSGIVPTDPTFTFAHRYFQQYFATCVVLREPGRVSAHALLTDASWRETAVTVCQTRPTEAGAIVREADALFAAAQPTADDATADFEWPPGVLHALSLLQSGFAGKLDGLPDGLRQRASLLLHAAERGTVRDRRWMLEAAGIAPDDDLADMLRSALRGRSALLREVAYRQVARLAAIPADVAVDIRRALIRSTAERTLRRDWLATRAQLLRLRPAQPFLSAAYLLRWVAIIDGGLHALAGALLLILSSNSDASIGPTVIVGLVFASHLGLYAAAAFVAGLGAAGATTTTAWTSTRTAAMLLQIAALYARGGLFAFGVLAIARLDVMGVVAGVVAIFAATWSIGAVYACLVQPPQSVLAWPFVQLPFVRAAFARLRRTSARTYFKTGRGLVLYAAFLAAFVWALDNSAAFGIALAALVGVAFVALLIFAVRASLAEWSDRRAVHRWVRGERSALTSEELLRALDEVRSSAAAVRLLRTVRARRLLEKDDDAAATVHDLLRAIPLLGTGEGVVWRSDAFAAWIDPERLEALGRFLNDVPDELAELLDDVEHRQLMPVA